jgi:hypothetical protein
MKSTLTDNNIAPHESTYALLVRSEEKERNLFETAIYVLFVLCAVFSVWQFAHQPITIPTHIGVSESTIAVVDTAAPARS